MKAINNAWRKAGKPDPSDFDELDDDELGPGEESELEIRYLGDEGEDDEDEEDEEDENSYNL